MHRLVHVYALALFHIVFTNPAHHNIPINSMIRVNWTKIWEIGLTHGLKSGMFVVLHVPCIHAFGNCARDGLQSQGFWLAELGPVLQLNSQY